MMPRKTRDVRKKSQVQFSQKLILNQWLLSLFGVDHFGKIADPLRDEALEGLDENNIHHLHRELV